LVFGIARLPPDTVKAPDTVALIAVIVPPLTLRALYPVVPASIPTVPPE
jgi:hypothetical protein